MHDPSSLHHWIRLRSRRLASELSTDPYVRSARLLGYSLRSQVRGFFHDPRHPAARALLHHLFVVAVEAGDGVDEALRTVERTWTEDDDAKVLAGAWKALIRDAEDAITQARTVGATEAGTALDDPAREASRDAAFDAWFAVARDEPHAM